MKIISISAAFLPPTNATDKKDLSNPQVKVRDSGKEIVDYNRNDQELSPSTNHQLELTSRSTAHGVDEEPVRLVIKTGDALPIVDDEDEDDSFWRVAEGKLWEQNKKDLLERKTNGTDIKHRRRCRLCPAGKNKDAQFTWLTYRRHKIASHDRTRVCSKCGKGMPNMARFKVHKCYTREKFILTTSHTLDADNDHDDDDTFWKVSIHNLKAQHEKDLSENMKNGIFESRKRRCPLCPAGKNKNAGLTFKNYKKHKLTAHFLYTQFWGAKDRKKGNDTLKDLW